MASLKLGVQLLKISKVAGVWEGEDAERTTLMSSSTMAGDASVPGDR